MSEQFEQNHKVPPIQKGAIERGKGVAHIHKPEGTHTIFYGSHVELIDPEKLPKKFHGLFLETGYVNYSDNPLSCLKNEMEGGYQKLLKVAERKKIPVYFHDPYMPSLRILMDMKMISWMSETAIGAFLLEQIAEEAYNLETQKMTRRDVLKLGAGLAATAWLETPFMSHLINLLRAGTDIGNEEAIKIQKLSYKIHPEQDLIILGLRNTVMAHKQEWLMKQMGHLPHMVTVLGRAHVGIEDLLQYSPEDRLAFLRSLRPLINQIVVPETFYQITSFNYDGKKWQTGEVYEVPELKELIKPSRSSK